MTQGRKPPYTYVHGGSDVLLPAELSFARKDEPRAIVEEPPRPIFFMRHGESHSGDGVARELVEELLLMKGSNSDTESYLRFADMGVDLNRFFVLKDVGQETPLSKVLTEIYEDAWSRPILPLTDHRLEEKDGGRFSIPLFIHPSITLHGSPSVGRVALLRALAKDLSPQIGDMGLIPVEGFVGGPPAPPVVERICEKCEGKGGYMLLAYRTCNACHGEGKVA